MSRATTTPCPICGRPALRRPANPAHPFCSARCRLVDLGNWFGETYRVPGPLAGDGGDPAARELDRDEEEP